MDGCPTANLVSLRPHLIGILCWMAIDKFMAVSNRKVVGEVSFGREIVGA